VLGGTGLSLDEIYKNAERRLASSKSGGEQTDEEGILLMKKPDRTLIGDCLLAFKHSSWVQDEALELYVNAELLAVAVKEFRNLLRKGMTSNLGDMLAKVGPGQEANELLFPLFAEFVLNTYKEEIRSYRALVSTADLRTPHTWYPVARAMKRRFIYHAGPTNSGKTHNALMAMQSAEKGLYCAPLRLLAMEIYDRCNTEGIYCSLVTGQEKQIVPGAEHISCTIEMLSTTKHVDVAVIDEIQMIGDQSRGWAWTRAVQGTPAKEVHVCGDYSALKLVQQLVEEVGDTLEVCEYDRFTELEIEANSLEARGGYSSVQPGDCVVAFSRRDIYAIKAAIEGETGLRACVVYGALPPEMRRIQAQLFNDPESGYDVMVASDAVGMGLNLNIRRVIFHTLTKFEGSGMVPVSVSLIKQIAGRAGRRSSKWKQGYATCYSEEDMAALRHAMNVPMSEMETPLAGLFPEFEHIEMYASQVPGLPFDTLLNRFATVSQLDGKFFFCKQDSLLEIAKLLERVKELSIKDRYIFCTAPVNTRDSTAAAHLLRYAMMYCRSEPCALDIPLPKGPAKTDVELSVLESQHQLVTLWLSLSSRFDNDDIFAGKEAAEGTSAKILNLISESLEMATATSSVKSHSMKQRRRLGEAAGSSQQPDADMKPAQRGLLAALNERLRRHDARRRKRSHSHKKRAAASASA